MTYAIKLLKKELKKWRRELSNDLYEKKIDVLSENYIKKYIKMDKKMIAELEKAIELLTKNI